MVKLSDRALYDTSDFPIKHEGDVHSGKVRSVYWLTDEDSRRLIGRGDYDVWPDSQLGVMIISDRISAFECGWEGQEGLRGVPGKGAVLNAVSEHYFRKIKDAGIANHHLLESPHPLVWIVQKAEPIMIEAIARQYITGSMWRDYKQGVRDFCGIPLPEGLRENQRLENLLITPSTKGVMKGIPGVPEDDDVNITRKIILDNYQKFGFGTEGSVEAVYDLLPKAFGVISEDLARMNKLFVDSKFELGYFRARDGSFKIGFIDEAATPDSSRIWDAQEYSVGRVVEESKEGFRNFLKAHFGKVMTDKTLFGDRKVIARHYRVPVDQLMEVSDTYRGIGEKIIGRPITEVENPRLEIMDVMSRYGLAD